MYEPIRGGTRGGQAEFKWSDVSADKDREHYLGHSINAPTGRWQKNKDVHWYNRDDQSGADERSAEIKKIKELEAEALSVALGFGPTKGAASSTGATGANAIATSPSSAKHPAQLGPSSSGPTEDESRAEEEKKLAKKQRKEEKKARREEKKEKKLQKRLLKDGDHRDRDSRDSRRRGGGHDRDRDYRRRSSRSLSPPPRHGDRRPRDYSRSRSRSRSRTPPPPPRRRERDDGEYGASEREGERERARKRWEAEHNRREVPGESRWGRR